MIPFKKGLSLYTLTAKSQVVKLKKMASTTLIVTKHGRTLANMFVHGTKERIAHKD